MYALKEAIQYTFSTGCHPDVATELYVIIKYALRAWEKRFRSKCPSYRELQQSLYDAGYDITSIRTRSENTIFVHLRNFDFIIVEYNHTLFFEERSCHFVSNHIYMSSDSIVRFLDELSENLDMIYNKIEQNIHENFPLMVIDNDEY